MKVRFKFAPLSEVVFFYVEDLREVSRPKKIPKAAERIGEYVVRGNKKGHEKTYYCAGAGKWYLSNRYKEDKGQSIVNIVSFNYLPQKSEKEWESLKRCYKYLSAHWKKMIWAYEHSVQIRNTIREARKARVALLH